MRILVYCQHVLGIGHLVRTLAITRALEGHKVMLVLGGPRAKIPIPGHVRGHHLPGLRMDAEFSGLLPVDETLPLERIKEERTRSLLDLFTSFRPQVLLIELFPFGRYGFRFELEPLLALARQQHFPCRVACSVRDILVERENRQKFEQRVIERLNRWFDLLLIHADPKILALDATFGRMQDIRCRIRYTGYIARPPLPGAGERLRAGLSLGEKDRLIVASAGGGSVGSRLLAATLSAHRLLGGEKFARLQVFTGPYLDEAGFRELEQLAGAGATLQRFSHRFPDWLAAADLSVSMGGYNTTMDILAAGCPALIHPFAQNREQRLRAECLRPLAPLQIIEKKDLQPEILAQRLSGVLQERKKRKNSAIRMHGAAVSARLLTCRGETA